MTDKEARELAEAHWKWLESLLHKIYVDAMIHGIKHGEKNDGVLDRLNWIMGIIGWHL